MEDFLSCAMTLGLEDVYTKENAFTWTNRTVWSKIDRVLVNADWYVENLHCVAEFMDFNTISDHTPVHVNFVSSSPPTVKPFRYLNMWQQHPSYMEIIGYHWNESYDGTNQYIICKKLKALKYPLKRLNKNAFSKISERVDETQKDYSQLIKNIEDNPHSEMLRRQVKLGRMKVNSLLEAERSFFQQKLRKQHLLHADNSSKYFHSLMKKNSASTFVAVLEKVDGTITTKQDEVIMEFQNYFQSLIGTHQAVSPTQDKVFTAGEILSD